MPVKSLLGICVCPKSLLACCKRSNRVGYFRGKPRVDLRALDPNHIVDVVEAYSGLLFGDRISLADREAVTLDNHNRFEEGVLACLDSRR